MEPGQIQIVLFDYGGVLAEEGFTNGLHAIAGQSGLEAETFFHTAAEIMYDCQYVTGKTDEATYWELVRQETGISGSDIELTGAILDRFILRREMMQAVEHIKQAGLRTAILSDQTDWLYRLEERDHFLHLFNPVLNSYHLGITKRDPEVFPLAAKLVNAAPGHILFIDDNAGHIDRAASQGLQTHHFQSAAGFMKFLKKNLSLEIEP